MNAWLHIPADEYEGHMAEVGQTVALREIFEHIYARTRPRRILVLGCTTGKDFELLDPEVTSTAVGVDVNGEYLAIAQRNLARSGRSVELLHADVLEAVAWIDVPGA